MAYAPLAKFLFRAPLLPLRSLSDAGPRLMKHPLGPAALALASPDLAAGLARGAGSKAAVDRYHRRAAFRPTPHGLFAGVGLGTLAARSQVRTGEPAALPRVAWGRLAALGRALLESPALRRRARLRRAPSLVVGAHTIVWVGPGTDGGFGEERRADLDDLVEVVLANTQDWTSWPVVRAALARAGGEGDSGDNDDGVHEEVDEFLATLLADGLLHADLIPPLVGGEPLDWMLGRLEGIPEAESVLARLRAAREAVHAGDPEGVSSALQALPGAASPLGVDATLLFTPARPVTLSRPAVTRAAALAPLLFRLQEALASPVAERTPALALDDALAAATEVFGAGAFDLGALALGDYGVTPAGADADAADTGGPSPGNAALDDSASLITLLVDRFTDAARLGASVVALRSEELDPLVPAVAAPPTCELFATPCRIRPGKPAGEGWLIGVHGPAGASWGRFAHALGEQAASLLGPLRDGEQHARPGEEALDVVFTPSEALADICAHPALRRRALALSSWPAEEVGAITIGDLELIADPAALEPLALRTLDGHPVAPSPLQRARSTTAPPGLWRLLVGWSLQRQHAPWALTLGPLSGLAWTPRVSIDGFVVAPASWRVPAALITAGGGSVAAVRAWRRADRVPRFVQVGSEDELLPVDLEAPGAAADLVGHRRAFEIWPPLGDTPDESGRRLEAVIGLVDEPDADARARIEAGVRGTVEAGAVPPPRRGPAAGETARWHTYKLFGAADRQDAVLVDVVHPCVRAARRAREIPGWFFLRYVEGPGRRPHLRLRVRVEEDSGAFRRRLQAHLQPALDGGDVVAVETASYFPEAARFGGPQLLPFVHALFEADSDRACALLVAEAGSEGESGWSELGESRLPLLVAVFDETARALGLDGPARRELARRRREAHAADVDQELAGAHARLFRTVKPLLRGLLTGQQPASVAAAFRRYEARVKRPAASLVPDARQRLLPALLHLSAVRLTGIDRDTEIAGYTFWERTLESLERHRPPT